MRGPGLLIIGFLIATSTAWAQPQSAAPEPARVADAPASGALQANGFPAAGAPSSELLHRDDELARLRGRGTTRVVIGAVMLGLGLILGGISTLLWTAGDAATGYANEGFNAYYQGAVAMDTIAFGLIGGGTTLLAIGAGNIAEGKRPRLYFTATSLTTRF